MSPIKEEVLMTVGYIQKELNARVYEKNDNYLTMKYWSRSYNVTVVFSPY